MSFLQLPVGGTRDQTKKTPHFALLSGETKFQSQGRGISKLDARPFEKLLELQTRYSETHNTHNFIPLWGLLRASKANLETPKTPALKGKV